MNNSNKSPISSIEANGDYARMARPLTGGLLSEKRFLRFEHWKQEANGILLGSLTTLFQTCLREDWHTPLDVPDAVFTAGDSLLIRWPDNPSLRDLQVVERVAETIRFFSGLYQIGLGGVAFGTPAHRVFA